MKNKLLASTANAPRRHRGDIMSPEKRSQVMSRIKGTGTGPERAVAMALDLQGLVYEQHARDLPGRPDFVFREKRIAVFIDGDFWHGWRFPCWRDKLSEHWEGKIQKNRDRDQRNHRRLRRLGWKVIRIWEHQVKKELEKAVGRIIIAMSNNG